MGVQAPNRRVLKSDGIAPSLRELVAIGREVLEILTRALVDVAQVPRRRSAAADSAREAEKAIYSFGDLPDSPEVLAIIEESKAKARANRQVV